MKTHVLLDETTMIGPLEWNWLMGAVDRINADRRHTAVSLGKAAHRCDAPCVERCVLAGPGKSSARGGLFKDADGKWRRA